MLMEIIHRKIASLNNTCFGQVLAPQTSQFQTVWKAINTVTILTEKTTATNIILLLLHSEMESTPPYLLSILLQF